MYNNSKKIQQKNNSTSFGTRWVKYTSILCWFITLIILFFIDKARPPFESYLNRLKNMYPRKTWNSDLVQYAFYLSVFIFILSISSFIVNIGLYKKKGCPLSISPILLTIFSLIVIIVYFTKFF